MSTKKLGTRPPQKGDGLDSPKHDDIEMIIHSSVLSEIKKKKIIHNCQILACPKILVEYSMKKVCLNSVHEILGYKKIMFVLKYENNFYNEKKNMKS